MRPKTFDSPIIKRIEALIKTTSHIPQLEIMQIMMKAENNSDLDIEKELDILNEKYDKNSL